MGCGGVGDGGAPARFLGEALAWELREGSVKVVVRLIWRIGGRGWEFHGELGLGGIHGGGKGVLQLRRGWAAMCGSVSSVGLWEVLLQGWIGQRGRGVGCPREG